MVIRLCAPAQGENLEARERGLGIGHILALGARHVRDGAQHEHRRGGDLEGQGDETQRAPSRARGGQSGLVQA